MTAFYNENDPKAAAGLRALIEDGLIAPGIVDERSIEKVEPNDIKDFTQCHFFAGIGLWSVALRKAGWADDRPVWTGSCPCQPFSAAGKQKGQADERHLWPLWFRLIRQCRPAIIFGEQVSSAIAHGWLDEVAYDLEGENYAIGTSEIPACAAGAFHKRERLWFVADAFRGQLPQEGERPSSRIGQSGNDQSGFMAVTDEPELRQIPSAGDVLEPRTDKSIMADAQSIGSRAGLCQVGSQQDGNGIASRSSTSKLMGNAGRSGLEGYAGNDENSGGGGA